MKRTQLLLELWQLEALRSAAERQGGSISSLVRDLLTAHMGRNNAHPARRGRLGRLDGIFDDPGFSGRDHDAALHKSTPARIAAAKRTLRRLKKRGR